MSLFLSLIARQLPTIHTQQGAKRLAVKTKMVFGNFRKRLLPGSFPSWSKWRQILRILTKKEKIFLVICLTLFFSSLFFLGLNFYFKNTEIRPVAGGTYKEGLVGYPRFINPIYGVSSDVDRDLVQLLFSGLMKYDKNGLIVPDLAKEYKILEEGKVLEFYLKENVFWSDGEKLTTDDLIFTIETIQNPDYKSPLRANWLGVKVEKISDSALRFKLKSPYSATLENLTLKILPHHIWRDISPENFPLSIYNLQPIGSGPYQIKSLKQDKLGNIKSLTLTVNQRYFGKKPNIKEISFYFFNNEGDLISAAQKKEIQGFSILEPKNYQLFKKTDFRDYRLSLPRYFALFFNPEKSEILAEKKIRQALNYGTNKEDIIKETLLGQGEIVNSPILPEIYGFSPPLRVYQFDLNKAKEILEKTGFVEDETGIRKKIIKEESIFQFKSNLKLGSQGEEVKELQKCLANPPAGGPEIYPEGKITGFFGSETKAAVIKFQEKYYQEILEPWGFEKGTGLVSKTTRAKLNEICRKAPEETLNLSFSLVTVDQPLLVMIANLLKERWRALGIEIEIKTFDIQTLERDIIKPRNYTSLLFGEVLGAIPDPFPFWHSSQKRDPGLNLAIYEDKKADKLLEEARQTLSPEIRSQNLEEFQDILIEAAPAIFLYNPDYIYLVSKEIKGIDLKMIVDPSKRFSGIENWYIKTRRVLK